MSCNGLGKCDLPTHKRFLGKEYCWDCWCDLLHEQAQEYGPDEEEKSDDLGCSPMWEKKTQ